MDNNIKMHDIYSELEKTDSIYDFKIDVLESFIKSDYDKNLLNNESYIYANYYQTVDIIDKKDELIEYTQNRIQNTNNPFLIARYYHFLFNISKRKDHCCKSLQEYIVLFELLIEKNDSNDQNMIFIILNWIANLGKKIKFDLNPIKKFLTEYLTSGKTSTDISYQILLSIRNNYEKWKPINIEGIPKLCSEFSLQDKSYYGKKNWLEIGVFFAQKSQNKLLSSLYEQLGDNEEMHLFKSDDTIDNLITPYQNQGIFHQMMVYYNLSGNKEKYKYAAIRFNNNKANLKVISSNINKKIPKEILDRINQVAQKDIRIIIEFFSKHNPILLPPHSFLDFNKLTNNKKYYHLEMLRAVRYDLNGNIQYTTNEEQYVYLFYLQCISRTISITLTLFAKCINEKKITYSKLKKVLVENTNFGEKYVSKRDANLLEFCIFDKIDYALIDFFKQFQKEIKGLKADWRIVITTFTTQFEGILRNYMQIQYGETSKIERNKEDVSELLLEELLRSNACQNLFSEEDRDLFLYTFTRKGMNIRNDIAHGFYLPQDYTLQKAILVFLCILKLVKFYK